MKDQNDTGRDARDGKTLPAQGDTTRLREVPRQPHERDESADAKGEQEPSGQRMGQLAHDDLESGRRDTDKGPVLDKTYDKLK